MPLPSRRLLANALALAITASLAGCATAPASQVTPATPSASMPATADNPLFAPSPLQWEYPQFDKIKIEHFAPAFDRGMQEERAEFEAIANNPEPATFDNTIVAMEKTGAMLNRVMNVFSLYAGADTNPTIEKISEQEAPKLAAHQDAIYLNAKLFARIQKRGLPMELQIGDAYLRALVDAYNEFFYHYDRTPVLTVAAEHLNPLDSPEDFALLVERIETMRGRKEFFVKGETTR